MQEIGGALARIVGQQYVSHHPEEQFIYSRDLGTMEPSYPDFVVLPNSTEEVRQILLLANEKRIPVVPMGGGLTLSGLCRPLRGGIVLDMKRMNRILEINEASSYAVVEAGASQGMLQAYLKKHHPTLKHSMPDSPPIATIGGNVLIHGSGHLSAMGGFHSDMLNGLEVVLPTGEVLRVGSCSVSPHWFSRAPLPDLAGLERHRDAEGGGEVRERVCSQRDLLTIRPRGDLAEGGSARSSIYQEGIPWTK